MRQTTAKLISIAAAAFMLSGCFAPALDFFEPDRPQHWTVENPELADNFEAQDLRAWWTRFDDHILNELVQMGLKNSPQRAMAEARIREARGIRRTSRAAYYPQINGTAGKGRSDQGFGGLGDFYDYGFDASFEIDVFGKIRKNVSASQAALDAAKANYHDTSLTLIGDIARTYITYRGAQKQTEIAKKNLNIQEKTLAVIKDLYGAGEITKLDLERANALVYATRASVPAFERDEEAARLQLTILTGFLPEELQPLLATPADIPPSVEQPILAAPAEILRLRPDIKAAQANLLRATNLSEVAVRELLPSFSISGLYGISKSALFSSQTIWSVAGNAAVALIDFGRLEGQIDASRAREKEAFEMYRLTILEAVVEVETALSDYAKIKEQQKNLKKSYNSADQSFRLSRRLYDEGEINFIDLLDAQRSLNDAESQLITAQMNQAESLTRLYKAIGVY